MTHSVEERLRKVLLAQLDHSLAVDEIGDETSLYGKGLGLDSVDVVSLIVGVEEEFDIFFEAEEIAASVATFGSLARAIEQKLR